MDTIRMYLDNLFASLPKTQRVLCAREELLSNMEDRYDGLKALGKSENEAIGVVISEFGNIDELLSELNIHSGQPEQTYREATEEQVGQYFTQLKKYARMIAWGVSACIIAPAVMVLSNQLISDAQAMAPEDTVRALSLIPFFICIVIGVGLIIYGGMRLAAYKKLEQEYVLPEHLHTKLYAQFEEYRPAFIVHIVVGVAFCVLSPVPVIISGALQAEGASYAVVALLIMIAVGVQFFIRGGMREEGYKKMLKLDEYSIKPSDKNAQKVIGIVASIVWPLATLSFLIAGFGWGLWHSAWIVFPIVGILFGAFSGVYKQVKGEGK